MLQSIAGIADAYEAGQHWSGFWRRGAPAMTSGVWTDMTYAAGIPVANYYAAAPYISATLSAADGINHGPAVNAAGFRKYLHKALLMPVAAIGQASFIVHDIVMFYPFVDGDGGEQPLDNQITIPRYGGVGCKIMLVSQGAGVANAVNTQITYTSADDVQRTMTVFTANSGSAGQCISAPPPGTACAVSNGLPYLPLVSGDRGVKRVDSVNMLSGCGGIFAVVICKPLGIISMQINETTPIEVDFMRDRFRTNEIEDGAYIGIAGVSSTTATPATLHGQFDFIWK